MKTHILTLLLVPAVLACNNHKKSAKSTRKSTYYSKNNIPAPASGQTEAAAEFTCKNKPSGLDYNVAPSYEETVEDKRIQELINRGNYQSSYSSPNTNFQGATGAGTGSSYASSYYGSDAKKQEIKTCTTDGSTIEVVKPKKRISTEEAQADEFSQNVSKEENLMEDENVFSDTTSAQEGKAYGFDSEELEDPSDVQEAADTTGAPIW